jgi:D-amino-acid dehydrogenase
MSLASLALHESLSDRGFPVALDRRGVLSVFRSERALASAHSGARALNFDVDIVDPSSAQTLVPGLTRTIVGGLYYRGDAHCNPGGLVAAMLASARTLGADIQLGVDVLGLRRINGRISQVETTSGTISPAHIVLAAGMWSRALARSIGVRLPLQSGKGYHIELGGSSLHLDLPVYMEEQHVVATPVGDRVRFAGTLELSGMDMGVNPVRVAALRRAATATFPGSTVLPTVQVWRGLRPCTPDGLPIIGQVDEVKDLYVATGHGMLGITLGLATGDLVARMIYGQALEGEATAFSPSRFAAISNITRNIRCTLSPKHSTPREHVELRSL